MSDCSCSCNTGHETGDCPICGATGQSVPSETISHLVTGVSTSPADEFYACLTSDCEAVYFSRSIVVRQANVSVPVGWKEGSSSKYACYCNHVTEDQVIDAVLNGGARTVGDVSRLTGAMKNGNCLLNNPKGCCCHSDIQSLISRGLG